MAESEEQMKKIKNYYSYIYLNTKTAFNSLYIYKAASLLNFIMQIIMILSLYFLWSAIYSQKASINNFNFQDMITYLVITFSIGRLYPFNVSNKFGRMVKSGDVIHNLLKPIAIEYQLLTDSLGELLYKIIFTATPIILTGYLFLDINLYISPYTLTFTLLFWVSSYIFIFVLELSVGMFSYYTNSLWGINNFKSSIINILSGKILPLNFYPKFLTDAIYFLPFSTIYFIPVNILMDKPVNNVMFHFFVIWISIFVLCIFYSILSKIMIKKIMIQGG